MSEGFDVLLKLLDLEQVDENLFRGITVNTGTKNVFGGQVLGQALEAASRTVDGRLAHSLHAYFLRAGDINSPIDYEVDCIRDGRSFATRRINAMQDGKAIFTMAASFKPEEEGLSHQNTMPDVKEPEAYWSQDEMRKKFINMVPEKYREAMMLPIPIEIRPIDPVNPFMPEKKEPIHRAWFKADGQLGDSPHIHRSVLAYASDFGLLGTAMLPHGLSYYSKQLQLASLDHAMWFHRPFRADEWLLYDVQSPSASDARGLNIANIYNQEGVLVASTAQEGLMRVHPKKDG